jgi:multiple sugar transport system permease protein
MEKALRPKRSKSRYLIIALIVIIALIYMTPIMFMIKTSITPWSEIKNPTNLNFTPSIGSYIRIFFARVTMRSDEVLSADEYNNLNWYEKIVYNETHELVTRTGDLQLRFLNSIIISVSSTIITIIFATMSAYAFSRFKLRGKDDLLFMILSTRMLPPVVALIPIFLMYKALKITDTHIGIILLYVMFNISFAIWVLKGFIDEIPREYEEAALVDGYSRFQAFYKVVVPQAITGITATAVFVFIFCWNEYAFVLVLTNSVAQTVPAWLPYQWGSLGLDWGALAAGGLLFIIPVMVLTIFLRKYLVRGITFGAIRK